MPNIEGMGFGGRVWSYGDLDAFRTDYQATQRDLRDRVPVAPLPPPKGEPVDTGLTRYLGHTGNAELKQANLARIDAYVEKFKLENNGALPESKKTTVVSAENLGKQVFGAEGVGHAVQTLSRMLENKTLAAKQSVPGQEKATLTAEESAKIAKHCSVALEKVLLTAAMNETLATMRPDGSKAFLTQKASMLNAALGIAEMLQAGQISEDAVVTLMRDGKMLDMSNTLDVTLMLKDAAEEAQEKFTQEKALNAALEAKRKDMTPDAYKAAKDAIDNLVTARKRFTRVLDFKVSAHDPAGKLDDAKFQKQQLQDVKLRLQQFRFDLQRCTSDVGREFGHAKYSFYGVMEQVRRSASNRVGDRHLDQRFATNKARNAEFKQLVQTENAFAEVMELAHLDFGEMAAKPLRERSQAACATTHNANDGARVTQSVAAPNRAWTQYGNKVLDMLQEAGGMRTVSTEVSVSALFGAGVKGLVEAEASVGGFRKTAATISCNKNGGFAVTLSTTYGARGGVEGDLANGTGDVSATGEVSHGHETTLAFGSRDELIAFCRLHAPKLLQTIPGARLMTDGKTLKQEALPRLYTKASFVTKAGKFLGSMLGLRIHKSKNFNETRFENKLQNDHVFTRLDTVLAQRQNALAVSRTTQSVTGGGLEAEIGVSEALSVKGGANVTVKHDAVSKGVKTARQVFARHTADEMKGEVDEAVLRFDGYRKDLPGGEKLENISTELKKIATSHPDDKATANEKAAFWLEQTAKLDRAYRNLEKTFVLDPKGLKGKDSQILFAETTRLFAVVNETVAKNAEENGGVVAAKSARCVLGAKLARPGVALDMGVYYERMLFGQEVAQGNTKQFSTSLEANWNPGVVSSRIMGKMTATIHGGKNDAVQPWKHTDSLKFDLEVGYPVNFTAIYRAVEKLVQDGIKKNPGDATFKQKALSGLKQFGKAFGIGLGEVALDEVDKKAAQVLQKVINKPVEGALNGLNTLLEKVGFGLEAPTFKEIQTRGGKVSVKFDDGVFTTFTYSDYANDVKKLNIKLKTPLTPLGFSFGKKDVSRQETVAFEMLPNMPLPTLMSRCSDLMNANGAAGPSKVSSFLRKNQKAVNALVAELRNPKDLAKISYADATLQGVRNDMEKLKDIANMKTHPAKLAQVAKDLHEKIFGPDGVWTKIAQPAGADESDETRVQLAANLSRQLTAAYGILAAVA